MCDCGATCATKEGEASASASSSASSGLALATVEAQPASTPARVRSRARRIVRQLVPDEILKNEQLNKAIAVLNKNYDFEVREREREREGRRKKKTTTREYLSFRLLLLTFFCFSPFVACHRLGFYTHTTCRYIRRYGESRRAE